MRAMILAAGFGTRLKPWTDYHPKALALVNGKSLLQRNIEYLTGFGIKDVIVNVHHFAEQITNAIKLNHGWGSNITISDETDAILETGGGLKRAAWFLKDEESFVLMNVDILTNMLLNEMIENHIKNTPLVTLAVTARQTSRYLLFNANNELCGWKNVKTAEEKLCLPILNGEHLTAKAFSGIHIINTKIFSQIQQDGKFSILEAYLSLCLNNSIMSFDHSEYDLIDVGKSQSIEKAEVLFK